MIHFKIEGKLGVTYWREGVHKDNYEEIWLPKNKIECIIHCYQCGNDTYYINEYKVTREEFKKALEELGVNY